MSASDIHLGVTGAERMLDRWLDRQRKRKAIVRFSVSDLKERMRRMIQQIRTQRGSRRLLSAMTTHQAKTRNSTTS